MEVYFLKEQEVVVYTDGVTAKINNGAPKGEVDGLDICSPYFSDRYARFLEQADKNGELSSYSEIHSDNIVNYEDIADELKEDGKLLFANGSMEDLIADLLAKDEIHEIKGTKGLYCGYVQKKSGSAGIDVTSFYIYLDGKIELVDGHNTHYGYAHYDWMDGCIKDNSNRSVFELVNAGKTEEKEEAVFIHRSGRR